LLIFISGITPAARALNHRVAPDLIQSRADTIKHKVYKKRKRVVRKVSSTRSARVNKQLKQANKHLQDEKKVQEAQHELKKDTTVHH